MGTSIREKEDTIIHYRNYLVNTTATEKLEELIPKGDYTYVLLCVGTDRSTGDALGPLIGKVLMDKGVDNLRVHGTLWEPVHAGNIDGEVERIKRIYENPFIIAVDASLGKSDNVGYLCMGTGGLKPGDALGKDLKEVGDAYFTGVVNMSGVQNFNMLQSTRLSFVYDMANIMAGIILGVDKRLSDK